MVADNVPHAAEIFNSVFEDLKQCQTRVGDVGVSAFRVLDYVDHSRAPEVRARPGPQTTNRSIGGSRCHQRTD